ncbi:MAG: TetR/AcrR family transcriptional regulator [Candidatus Eremiobacteraeota bacterium]|nr:TetR/AcrR family transcriptional regulator [Candidatus Eremiobacteraeota bacterium]
MKHNTAATTQERIKHSAQTLFAERGFWGTSVQEIADKAEVNKAMLFYYFKSKENLYFSIIEEIFSAIIVRLEEKMKEKSTPPDRLMVVLTLYGELYSDSAHFDTFRILMQDIMGPGERVRDKLRGHVMKVLNAIAEVIREGVALKVFKEVDPYLSALSILGMLYIFARHRLIFGLKLREEEVVKHLYTTILEGIKR